MKRLLFAPAVVGVVGAAAGIGYVTGYLWPVATQAWSVLAPRRETEADPIG